MQEPHEHDHPDVKTYLGVFIALLVLLVVTVLAAEIELGRWGFLVAVVIASIKAALIMAIFMHVRYSTLLTRLFSASAFFFLAILFVLTLSDYWAR